MWCAAGKGTFGTEELLQRISSSNLGDIVNHRTLILPQLAGPGVAAFEVKKRSGFKVVYGPVEASDLPSFLDTGLKATPAMRTKTFSTAERLVLVPVEVMGAVKIGMPVLGLLFLLSFLLSRASLDVALRYGYNALQALLFGIIAGAFFTPLLLPWLPGKAFAMKGLLPGIAGAIVFFVLQENGGTSQRGTGNLCVVPADPGLVNVPRHELYRVFDVYVPFRGEEGDAVGRAHPNCRGDGRPGTVVHFFLYALRL